MLQFKTIVVPTDFSDQSQVALNYAIALARQFGSAIHCVHVIDQRFLEGGGGDAIYVSAGHIEETMRSIREHARKRLSQQTQKVEAYQLKAESHVREGRPVEQIQEIAKELKADLMVVATHGRSGLDHMLLGSTTEKLLRKASVPVLTVRPHSHGGLKTKTEELAIKKILVPLDFSDFSHKALPTAVEFAKAFGSTVVLVHVVDTWLDYPEWGP
ncbi:MAG: universal stress protein, partial [Candidatus Hydrogenedentales bacterium]